MTQWTIRLIIAIRSADQTAANNAFANKYDQAGGQDTFTNGLSTTGSAPPQAYWASMVARRDQLTLLKAFADAFPKAEIFIWDEVPDGVIDQIKSHLDLAKYRDPNPNTRTAARVRIARQGPEQVLDTLGLQVIGGQ